jgi:ABC-type transport system substrate-binding protein
MMSVSGCIAISCVGRRIARRWAAAENDPASPAISGRENGATLFGWFDMRAGADGRRRVGAKTRRDIDHAADRHAPSPSLHEEATVTVVVPFMGSYHNPIVYDRHRMQNRDDTIVPDLATKWTWDANRTALTFTLREGVKWHDAKPFTSADVKCAWDMVSGLTPGKIRKSPRQEWHANLK